MAELDMTDNKCPSTLTQSIDSNKHTCVINSTSVSCAHVNYSIDAIRYSQVCGKIKAYQIGSYDAFGNTHNIYVDGISLTYGRPRNHI